jgi:hypothetical protein
MPMDMPKRPGALTAKGGSGYTAPIPSPQQGYNAPTRRPSSAGGDRDARNRAIMGRPEMANGGRGPTAEDIPNMSLEEIDMYNKPQMDINDAFFGPDNGERFDIIEFLVNLFKGGNR